MCMQVMDIQTDGNQDHAVHARMFHALSDERRLRILTELRSGEQCVCDLQAELGMAQSLLSFHLKALREAGLVRVRRSGRWAHYSIDPEGMAHVATALGDIGRTPAPGTSAAGTTEPCCAM